MDGTAPLDRTTLARYLKTVLLALGEAHTRTGYLTAKMIDNQLTSDLFMVAVTAGWIPEPRAPLTSDTVRFGYYTVDSRYREEFLELIQDELHGLREIAGTDGDESYATVLPEWATEYDNSRVRETSPEERAALVEEFLRLHKHPVYRGDYQMRELHWLTSVRREQFDRWRRGEIPNDSKPGRRILALLEKNLPHKNPKNLKPRERKIY
jgi:hypothetical protein